ncbi:MAG: beta-propeller domain-containing protein [Candidatus Gracilibacteria bacterium]
MKLRSILFNSFLVTLTGSVFLLTTTYAGTNTDTTLEAEGFSDVSEKNDNVKAIEFLQANGIVEGYEDETYRPENNINRAEFLKIVMEASDYELGGSDCYPDVKDEWFAPYICAATELGLVEGYDDGTFKPENDINFAEGSKIVTNVLGLEADEEGEEEEWYSTFVYALEDEEAIPISISSFDDQLTRAEMAEMIWRILAERTYKPFHTYDTIATGKVISPELSTFNSCQELHDYFEDNAIPPYDEEYTADEGTPEDAVDVSQSYAEKGGCFTGKTQILMADGTYKAIEDIEKTDEISTRKSENSSELVAAEVKKTVRHLVPGYLVINEDLEVTPEHRLFINGDWDVAGDVKEGDYLMNPDGTKVEVWSVRKVNEPSWVYNFEVENYHTYIANDFYVHNDKGESAGDFSSTNTQVSGVDEADIVKNDGQYIYYRMGSSIRIVDAYPASSMRELTPITFEDENFYPSDMYLDGDSLVVLGDTYYYDYYDDFEESEINPTFYYQDGAAKVYVYDVSDPEDVELIREVAFEGDYSSSRKVDDAVYVVVQQDNYIWPWMNETDWKEEDLVPLYVDDGKLDKLTDCDEILYMPEVLDETNYLIVASIPLDPDEEISEQVVMGSSSDIFASTENLYVAQAKYNWYYWYDETGADEETYIHKFGIDGPQISYKGMGTVPGTILNQFSMDEHDDTFRIATTLGFVWDADPPAVNNVYVFDEDMNRIGELEGLAPGEKIYAMRFIGDRAYMVTFKKVDPLFVIDMEDPENPSLLGELKIPGFSDYLHPFDENHLIGFGLDAEEASEEETEDRGFDFAWYQGIKIAMFDVSDVENPTELHREIIGDRGTSSPVSDNHKAFLYSTSIGNEDGAVMGFPLVLAEIAQELKDDPDTSADTYGDYVYQGAYVYDVSVENGFELRGSITHYPEDTLEEEGYDWYGEEDIERIIYIGDYFYTISQTAVVASEMLSPLNEVQRLLWGE